MNQKTVQLVDECIEMSVATTHQLMADTIKINKQSPYLRAVLSSVATLAILVVAVKLAQV